LPSVAGEPTGRNRALTQIHPYYLYSSDKIILKFRPTSLPEAFYFFQFAGAAAFGFAVFSSNIRLYTTSSAIYNNDFIMKLLEKLPPFDPKSKALNV